MNDKSSLSPSPVDEALSLMIINVLVEDMDVMEEYPTLATMPTLVSITTTNYSNDRSTTMDVNQLLQHEVNTNFLNVEID